ncbi:MAG TPA: endonuclease/exonuclease/phosphatase family protein [Gemmatimonadota bacterium]|nr:endonuclease/exonuclease/phosphatase family protein [Gemmatimonadota bacterium]
MSDILSLRIATFNAWALPLRIPTQDKRRRLERLPEALVALDADVIVLQEMFDVKARRRLLREMCPPYETTPEARRSRRALRFLPIDASGGLVVLSRLPIASSRFVAHPAGLGRKPDERVGRKGAMFVRIKTPVGPLTLLAIHLYAGTRPKDTVVRSAQLAPLLRALELEADGTPVVLAGDINTSPTLAYPASPGPENPLTPEYAALLAAGFIDPLPPNPTPASRSATWVPSRNRYAALPYQETKTDERYDYVMVRPGRTHGWKLRDAGTVLDGVGQYLSDHVGVLVELELTANGRSR